PRALRLRVAVGRRRRHAGRRHGDALHRGAPPRGVARPLYVRAAARGWRLPGRDRGAVGGRRVWIAVVEDEAIVAQRLERLIRAVAGADVESIVHASSLDEARALVASAPLDVLFLEDRKSVV